MSIEIRQSARGSQNYCQHEIDVTNMSIYPCCYQICCEKCNKKNGHQSVHSCAFSQDNLQNKQTIPVNLLTFSNGQLKKVDKISNNDKNIKLSIILCSVCQKSSSLNKKNKFYHCKNCDKDFCEKCQSIVHGKGKFMSHKVNQIQELKQNILTDDKLKCSIHNKLRRCLVKNKIVCQLCFKEQTGKQFLSDNEEVDFDMIEENVKFAKEYYNEIYHNQGNKISQTKQSLTKVYQEMIERIQQRYQWNMSQLQRTQTNLRKVFSKNIKQMTKIFEQVEIITKNDTKLIDYLSKDILSIRAQLINEKLYQVQSNCEDFMNEINFQYKVGDKEKYETLIEQFLKCLNITKLKRTQDQSIYSNRSFVRNHLKTSRTTSRPSSNRLTNSKDNRCLSSFKNNQYSSIKNSSFKDKTNFNKNNSNKKIEETPNSISSIKKNNINRSLSNRIPGSKEHPQGSKSNLNFFKDKQLNLKDVRDLQKAQYQDLNLNLKKLIVSRKPTQISNNMSYINKVSQRQSENTSLQKKNNQAENVLKKPMLAKQNQKSTINSGSFLKMFETSKSKVSARKNYLLSSGEDLSENQSNNKQHKSRIQIRTSNMKMVSPQNHSQLKKRNIKNQLYGSNPSSNQNFSEVQTYSKFVQSSSPPQKLSKQNNEPISGQSKRSQQNPSLLFDKLIAVSGQKSSPQQTSQFDLKCPDEKSLETINPNELLRSQISQFSTDLTLQSKNKNTTELIRNVQMTSSIQVREFNTKQDSQVKKSKNRAPSTSKVLQNKEINQNKQISTMSTIVDEGKSASKQSQGLKDTSNNLKSAKKNNHQKNSGCVQNEKPKKKPDFMDMRQRMRKPNYLSTRFGTNISHAVTNVRPTECKK